MRRMRPKRKRTKKTRNGNSIFFAALLALTVLSGVVEAKKKSGPAAAHAVVGGSVFRPPGFALPGARVRVEPESREAKLRSVQGITDSRGEFALRVPAVPMSWTVHVEMKGYQTQSRSVRIEGEQRTELPFVLQPVKPEGDSK
jgi:hypothetical protein